MKLETFGDELGEDVVRNGRFGMGNQLTNMLIHVLDDALGGGSGVPPGRDYFNGADPNAVMSAAFDRALTALGSALEWLTQPRDVVAFHHTLYPAVPEVAAMLDSNRATYAYIVVLRNPAPTSESILSLGQSGFILLDPTTGMPVFDAHFQDQLQLFRTFLYKPMSLFRNTQLQE